MLLSGVKVDPQQPGEQRHPGGDHAAFRELDGITDRHKHLPSDILGRRRDGITEPAIPR